MHVRLLFKDHSPISYREGIPQEVLDKLQKLRVRLEGKQTEAASKDGEKSQASPGAKSSSPPLLVDVGANLTNFRLALYYPILYTCSMHLP